MIFLWTEWKNQFGWDCYMWLLNRSFKFVSLFHSLLMMSRVFVFINILAFLFHFRNGLVPNLLFDSSEQKIAQPVQKKTINTFTVHWSSRGAVTTTPNKNYHSNQQGNEWGMPSLRVAPWELPRGDAFETWLESSLHKKITLAFSLCKRFHQFLRCWSLGADRHHKHYIHIIAFTEGWGVCSRSGL